MSLQLKPISKTHHDKAQQLWVFLESKGWREHPNAINKLYSPQGRTRVDFQMTTMRRDSKTEAGAWVNVGFGGKGSAPYSQVHIIDDKLTVRRP